MKLIFCLRLRSKEDTLFRASLGICQFKNYQCVRKECGCYETQCNQLKGCKFVDQQCERDDGAYQVKIKVGICGLVETIVSDKPFLYYPTPAIQGGLNPTSLLFDKDIENFNTLAIPLKEFGFQLNVSDQVDCSHLVLIRQNSSLFDKTQ